jgi:exonuclease SbcC
MRPRELTLQGFRSYRERTTFDLRDRRLIGVVGPIGSGKSSLLDAISFALFARTPTFERDTRSLIHQLDDAAHVELVFEVDGQIWRVQRGLRRKGASGHKLERLAADEPEAKVLESIQQEKAVRRQVERLLGMGFDAFRRSVLLAQNRFAEFLQASPVKRDEVLKGAFGYERFDVAHDVAKDRVRDAEAELLILEAEGGRLRQAAEERPPSSPPWRAPPSGATSSRMPRLGSSRRPRPVSPRSERPRRRRSGRARSSRSVRRSRAATSSNACCGRRRTATAR